MVFPTPRYASCRISGEQVEDGSYGCVISVEEMMEQGEFPVQRPCSCKPGECKAPGQQPS